MLRLCITSARPAVAQRMARGPAGVLAFAAGPGGRPLCGLPRNTPAIRLKAAAEELEELAPKEQVEETVDEPAADVDDLGAPQADPPDSSRVPTDSFTFASCAALAFSAVSFDVNSPTSLHLLQGPDAAVHGWVGANTTEEFRKFVADVLISDAFTVSSVVGWLVAGALLVDKRPVDGLKRLAVGGVFSVLGGAGLLKDPFLVDALKKGFHRTRPSAELHHTFSFPSGHTTGAVFTTGFLIFGLLLPLLALRSTSEGSKDASPKLAVPQSALILVWAASGVVTASGRMLADAHWLSDTLAGALLGAFLVSAGTLTIRALEVPASADKAGGADPKQPHF